MSCAPRLSMRWRGISLPRLGWGVVIGFNEEQGGRSDLVPKKLTVSCNRNAPRRWICVATPSGNG
jgi:hypothetical protein